MVANALIYHPALEHWMRFVATTGMYMIPEPHHQDKSEKICIVHHGPLSSSSEILEARLHPHHEPAHI